MNEQKTKKTNSIFQHTPQAPHRRVSFSKPSKFSKSPSTWQLTKGSTHGATEKSTPVPRVISFSRPSKSSLKQGSHNKTIGVCTRNKNEMRHPRRRQTLVYARRTRRLRTSNMARSAGPPPDAAPPPQSPLRRPARRVRLSRTEPIHLDIKPKRFPSMLWC
ncbi:uncharacterized protein LOC133532439 isoform X1 [Cydia pomonella]|uniref:uncharacterized protein LOC133532439 isoform X1 n=1 Tax=Cydia pomonella TaxID=82600 RepID=UPI002ADE6197|nr:uncharacterized protein LOC133532439 isoform X1 [Cydia pomonella]